MKNNTLNYADRERECEYEFLQRGPFWHLHTPGEGQELIFKSEDDYKFGITSSALSLQDMKASGLKLYAFAIMSNHIHNLLGGSREDCVEYFNIWKARIQRYFNGSVDLSKFKCKLTPINNLKSFRYELAYINRNGYVNNKREIPFSYEWASGRYHFNPVTTELPLTPIKEISCREKKKLFKSRVTDIYDSLALYKGYISPLSFCHIAEGEDLYNTPHQYFNFLCKAVEEYSLVAESLGDKIFLNDEEMYSIAYRKSKELYNIEPKLLPPDSKIELAKLMHHKYNASNSQINRILKLDHQIIDTLFPKAR